MTSVIFKDDGVLSQLHKAQKDRKDGISTYSDCEEEFAQLLKEVRNEKNNNHKVLWTTYARVALCSYERI